jgi:adenylyl-sulfate kinase
MNTPHVFWLFGLSGAGKSTLSQTLCSTLREQSFPVLALDGDRLRRGICSGLGFSAEDRRENLRRAAEVARLAIDSHLCVVASFITPLESHRQLVRDIIGAGNLSLIHISASVEVCAQRDVKGLYAGARTGAVNRLTGVSDPFEAPARVDFTVETGEETPAISASRLAAFALGRLAN